MARRKSFLIWKRCKYIVPILVVMLIIAGLCGCSGTERPRNKVVSGTDSGQRIAEIDSEDDYPLEEEKRETARPEMTDKSSELDSPVTDKDDTDKTRETSKDGDDSTSMAFSVHYIDVGQGDCTLVCCNGRSMLIDAGPNDKGTAIQMYLKKQGIEVLDYFVLTHPDSDHIGSADVIITKFNIKKVIMSPYPKENEYWRDVAEAMDYKGYAWFVPKTGEKFDLDKAKVEILQSKLYDDSNNSSIILRITYGDIRFLFTGDAEMVAENDLEKSGTDIRANVYQAGHHGSNTASSESFVKAVNPEYVVISCGKDNSYGHPHQESLDLFKKLGIRIFRLDEQTNVIAYSDSKTVSWSTSPSDNYEAGTYDGAADNIIVPENTDNEAKDITKRSKTVNTFDENADTSGNEANASENAGASDNEFRFGTAPEGASYIGNINNMKLHRADCNSLPKQQNQVLFDTLEEAESAGFDKDNQCKICIPYGK